MSATTTEAAVGSPHPLADRSANPAGTVVRVGGVEVGGREFIVAAGPCAVETAVQLERTASAVFTAGARLLRAGAFKPRTSPYAFQGLGAEGLLLLERAGHEAGLPVVTEVVAAADVALVARHADALQVGARNTQNFALLKALGGAGKPVLLKRGMSTTVDELLMAAEYVLSHGNPDVILCERGIRTFETSTRNTLDLNTVAVLKRRTHLPVIVDPSHGTGRRELVTPLAKAAAAVGADGLLIEVHHDPDSALSDGAQSLTTELFAELMRDLVGYLALEGRTLGPLSRLADAGPLQAYRDRIDEVDDLLVRLLHERAGLGVRVGRVKEATGRAILAPDREAQVVGRATAARVDGTLSAAAVARVFQVVVDETRAAQTPDAQTLLSATG